MYFNIIPKEAKSNQVFLGKRGKVIYDKCVSWKHLDTSRRHFLGGGQFPKNGDCPSIIHHLNFPLNTHFYAPSMIANVRFCHFDIKNKMYIYEKQANLWQKRINQGA